MGDVPKCKLVVIGDGSVGKTSLLHMFTKDEFPKEYVPTVFENTAKTMTYEGQAYKLNLWDTAGQEGYDRVRLMSYKNTDAFLMCFAVDNLTSLENIHLRWAKEISKHRNNKGYKAVQVVVGLKTDLRKTSKKVCATANQGEEMARKTGSDFYCECSAMLNDGVDAIFEKVVLHGASLRNKKSDDKCSLM